MRSLLFLVVLVVSASGCCCASGSCPTDCGSGCDCYTPGYRRACYPAYRPIDSAYEP
jgi:hypothetical protein